MALPNPGMAFSPFDILTAEEMNDLVENIEALAAGTGLDDGVITSQKLSISNASSDVDTQQSTSSSTYTNLSTTQSTVITVSPNGILIVSYSALIVNSGANNQSYMSFSLSGANTLSASDNNGSRYQTYAANAFGDVSRTILLRDLTPGSTTITALFRTTAGTASFSGRRISAIAL